MKFSKRERTLILITLSILIFGVYYQFIYSPKAHQISDIRGKLQMAKSDIAQAEIKTKSLSFLEQSKIQFLPKDVQLEKIIVHASKYPKIYVASITPTVKENTIKVEIVCSGTLKSFMNYLRSFGDLNLPLQIDSISMMTGEGMLNYKLVLISYFL